MLVVMFISLLDTFFEAKIESFQCWHPSSHSTGISDMFNNHSLNTLMNGCYCVSGPVLDPAVDSCVFKCCYQVGPKSLSA